MRAMKRKGDHLWGLLGLAWEMGYLIAIPLVGFALLGRFFDSLAKTSPLFFLLGILGAIALSSILVVQKVSQVLDSTVNEEGEEKKKDTDSSSSDDGRSKPEKK